MNEIVKETEASLELDTLGKRLRWEMKKKHLTAKAVAEELGRSRELYQRAEGTAMEFTERRRKNRFT